MSQLNREGKILPQNTQLDDDTEQPGFAYPISEAEIEELIYGSDRPAGERLERLREIRDDLQGREPADFGLDDPKALLLDVEQAIARLEMETGERADIVPAELGDLDDERTFDEDPLDHRETLSPDDDELVAIEDADEASEEEDEWDEGDDFRPERGTH